MAGQPDPLAPLSPRHEQLPLEARARVFTALQEVGNDLRADFSVSHLCRRICEAVHEVLGWRYVVLTTWDRDAELSRVAAVAGEFDESERRALMGRDPHPIDESDWFGREEYRVSHSYFVRAREGEPVDDPARVLFHGDRRKEEEGRWQPSDFLAVPLEHRGRITGVLSVDEPAGGRLPSLAHIRALEAFANQAAIAISNAEAMSETSRLAEEANQRARFLRSVLEISERIRVNEPLPHVAEYICDAARDILGWQRVVFMFRDLDEGHSKILAVAGYPEEERREILSRSPSPLKDHPWWAVEECRISNSYYVDHEKLDELQVQDEKVHVSELERQESREWHEEDLLVVPVVSGGDMWGILSVDDPADGREPDVQKVQSLEILANQAAVAIENTRLFSQQSTLAEEAESHAAFLDAILQLGQSVLWNTPIEEFGERVCSVIQEHLGWRRVVMTVRDERGLTSRPVACRGFSPSEEREIMARDPVDASEDPWYVEERFRISESYFVPAEDFEEIDAPPEELYFTGIEAPDDPEAWQEEDFLIVPLRFRDELIGAVSVDAPVDGRRPDGRNVRALEIVGNVAASAVRNAQLFQLVSRGKYEWEAAFDAIGEGIALFDDRRHFTRVNKAFSQMVDIPVNAFAGYSCCEVLADEEHDVIHELLDGVLDAEGEVEARPAETRLRGRMVRVSGYPMGDQAVLVFEDITEQRILERQVIQTEKMAAMGELMAGIAHDLNNPLTTVLGFSEIVAQKEGVDDETASMLELIRTQADRATRIVRNLLAFARRQEGEREYIAPRQIVEDSIQLLAHQARLTQISVENEVSAELPPIEVVTNQIEQVFVNLIQNAIQAIGSDGESAGGGRIRIRGEPLDGQVVLHFDDDGPGVPAEIRDEIFEPFFTTKPEGRGTGLGLSIARSIVREHGGTFRVDDSELGGARISLTVPAVSDLPEAEGPRVDVEAGGVSPAGEETSGPGEGVGAAGAPRAAMPPPPADEAEGTATPERVGDSLRVLIVDDETHILTFLSVALENEGFEVERAEGGREGLEKARTGDHDLIICDLRMPDLDGREVYRILSDEHPAVASRVLFSTGDTIRGGVMEFLEDLGRPFLPKPYSLAQIREVVGDFMAQLEETG